VCRALVVGAGPAGLACGRRLAERGADVTIYERDLRAGGLINLIPERRVNRSVIARLSTGLKIEFEREVDLNNLGELSKKFDYIIIAVGAQKHRKLGVSGEDESRVHYAVDYLQNDVRGDDVAVIGGGNVAIDCSTTAIARGAKTATLYYRRARADMKAGDKEITHAESVGVKFVFETAFDDLNKLKADVVVVAIGQMPELPAVLPSNVLVCGDAKLGPSTIAQAMKDAQAIADTILN